MLYYPVILGSCLKDSHQIGRHGNSIKWLERKKKKKNKKNLGVRKKYLAAPSSNRKNPASRDLTDAAELHGGLTDFSSLHTEY